MARAAGNTKGRKAAAKRPRRRFRPLRFLGFLLLRVTTILIVGVLALILLFTVINPPITHTIWSEWRRLGEVQRQWVPIEEVAPAMARSVVAAESEGAARAALDATQSLWQELDDLERDHRLPGSESPASGLAPAMHGWARGLPLDSVLTLADMAAGDFVRWAKQTIDLLDHLKRRYPATHFVWLMGADNLAQFPRWAGWNRIVKTLPVAAIARPSYAGHALSGKMPVRYAASRLPEEDAGILADRSPPAWIFLRGRLHTASATQIRKAAAAGSATVDATETGRKGTGS